MREGNKQNLRPNKSNKQKEPRINMICKFLLRLDKAMHYEALAFCFGRMSVNKFYKEMVRYCLDRDKSNFLREMEMKYARNDQQGHFTYHTDTNTLRTGRFIE